MCRRAGGRRRCQRPEGFGEAAMQLDEYRSVAIRMLTDADRLLHVHFDPVRRAAISLTDPTQMSPMNAGDRAAEALWLCLCELYAASRQFQADPNRGPEDLITAASAIKAI